MPIKRDETCHPEWMKKVIINGNNVNIFERTELESKLFWSKFAHTMRHLQTLADYVDSAPLPLGLSKVYIDLISNHLETIKDLLFVSYGLILDTNPKSKDLIVNSNHDNLIALGFWALDNQEEIECICDISSKWINNLINIDKHTYTNPEEIFAKKNNTEPSFLHNIDDQPQLSYIYAPYQDVSHETIAYVKRKCNEFEETMRSIFSLIRSVMMTPALLFPNFDALVKEFRQSDMGEKMISCWKSDFHLPKEQLLSKLKAKKDLQPWVDKICMLHEGKIEKKELFVDLTVSKTRHNPEIDKTRNWISIFTIYAILQEYDDQQKIVLDISPYFYNDEDAARKFLKQIQGAEPTMITSLVKKLVDKDKFPETLKSKGFHSVLVKHNLYTKSYQNWNDQM